MAWREEGGQFPDVATVRTARESLEAPLEQFGLRGVETGDRRLDGGDRGAVRLLVERVFERRGENGPGQFLECALRIGGEALHGFELVPEKIESHRKLRMRREHVDDPAANGELARLVHEVRPFVPEPGQLCGQFARLDDIAGRQAERRITPGARAHEPLGRRADGSNDHASARRLHRERGQTSTGDFGLGSGLVVDGRAIWQECRDASGARTEPGPGFLGETHRPFDRRNED
ncbi:MAG: hypothetical protein BWY66_02030 [bacterium ADurb.Bin374]|nr:MAG: hypothetical protein BWY66_02030 [bacterium ADurb.Bin374]